MSHVFDPVSTDPQLPHVEDRRQARRLIAMVLPLVVIVASACGGEGEAAGSAVTVVDSAGIQIVTSSEPAWAVGEEWRVSSEKILEIGMAEGPNEYLLSRVRSAHRRADGSVAVANSQSAEIRIFGADGRHLQTIGRKGGGPGEFDGLYWMETLPGDSILAYDMGARRLSVFSPEGDFVTASTIGDDGEDRFARVIGTFSDGSVAAMIVDFLGFAPREGEPDRMPETYVRIARTGELLDTLSRQPGTETIMQSSTSSNGMQMVSISPLLLGRASVAGMVGDRVVLGSNDTYELELVGPDGAPQRLIRRRVEPRPVTEQILEAAREERLALVRDEEAARRREVELLSAPHGSTVPFYESLIGDDEGNLWVEEFAVPGEEPPGWAVYDPDGKLLGSLALPRAFRPTHIGADFVLGIATDDLGVERVRMYTLEKSGAS